MNIDLSNAKAIMELKLAAYRERLEHLNSHFEEEVSKDWKATNQMRILFLWKEIGIYTFAVNELEDVLGELST